MDRYDSYKDSGERWLGEIPSHWEVLPLKRTTHLVDDKEASSSKVLTISLENIESRTGRFISTGANYEGIGVKFSKGDVLFGKLRPYLAKVYLADCTGVALGDIYVLRAFKVDNQYLRYLVVSKRYVDYIDSSTYGTKMPRTNWQFMGASKIPIPPLSEQRAIASYLDASTAKIDAAIESERKMIHLLEERKKIIINRAVTRGLDPGAHLKPSGVDWIGDIPEGWEVKKFKAVASVKANLVHPKDYQSYPQISPDNIEKDTGRIFGVKSVHESGVISDNHLFHKGQIIYSKIRPALNKVAIAPYDGLCSADMYPIETSLDVHYFVYYMLSKTFVNQVSLYIMDRVKMPKINKEELAQIAIIVPPKSEQKEIVKALTNQLDEINGTLGKASKMIDLLTERKQIIINEVVTGRIKVC